jgi:hypothetical protein
MAAALLPGGRTFIVNNAFHRSQRRRSVGAPVLQAGLCIRIDAIRIQHFSSIRIHKIFESGSTADQDPQRKIGRQIFFSLSFKNQIKI